MRTQARTRPGVLTKTSMTFQWVIASLALMGAGCELSTERHITILATNDIHGSVEPRHYADGTPVGGLSYWAGVVRSIRQGVANRYGKAGGVLLLDGGDQFQGTLLSNFSEGNLVYEAMDEMDYDAVIPGNHAYDFGPSGWLDDQVNPSNPDKNPRSVIESLAKKVSFPLLSANTFFKNSIQDINGNPVSVQPKGCIPTQAGPSAAIDWDQAQSPKFLKPYVVKKVAGVRVALIGIDHHATPQTTTPANVSDLCFREEAEAYLDVREKLEGRADVFVLMIHQGNTTNEQAVSQIVSKILDTRPVDGVHAVVAGHTHWVNHERVKGVPVVQSGANGEKFGRIDLVFDTKTGKLVTHETRFFAGVRMRHGECDRWSKSFCEKDEQTGVLRYEGVPLQPDTKIAELVSRFRKELEPVGSRVLGNVQQRLTRNRIAESSLADALTDEFRKATGAEVAMVNSSGLRNDLDAGPLTYEKFFEVLPFANRGVTLGPMPIPEVLALLERSAKTCGNYGALMQSGLRVRFKKDCDQAVDGVDPKASLVHVETLGGEVLFDSDSGIRADGDRSLIVATLDFLAAGGSGYSGFKSAPQLQDFGILREFLVERFLAAPVNWLGGTDHRWIAEPRE